MEYKKYDEYEEINIGDVLALYVDYDEENHCFDTSDKVIKAYNHILFPQTMVIGVCTGINNNTVTVQNTGICDINVTGIICLGDKLQASDKPGYASAIKYVEQDETIFGIRSIGKVISLYRDYSKAKILLDIE